MGVTLERNGERVTLTQQPHIDAFLHDGWKVVEQPKAAAPEVKRDARNRAAKHP